VEIGPRDIENGVCVLVLRHNGEKRIVKIEELANEMQKALDDVNSGLYQMALENREKRTYTCLTTDEIKEALEKNGPGFIRAAWCGDEECEAKVKELTGVGSRCMPLDEQENISGKCVCCGKEAHHMVLWGIAY
jgi:prolyl-tRNA synthetase